VLAARLSENPDIRVVLLEAGTSDGPTQMPDPAAALGLWGSSVDWAYSTVPQPGTDGAVHRWPMGKVLGGTSSINAMVHLRGHPSSYDAWEAMGARGWNYDSLLPYLRRSECAEGRDPSVRGIDGPMVVARPRPPGLLPLAWYQASLDAGHVASEDGNGSETEGISSTEINVVNGRRQSAADAHLCPAVNRPNLTVITNAHVRRLIFGGTHCLGAEYVPGGSLHTVRAEREVILAAGTIGSPQLLMLSGIGPAAHLRQAGLEVRADLAGVGQNLHDQVINWVNYSPRRPMSDGGPYANLPHLVCRSSPKTNPDLQLGLSPSVWGPRRSTASPDGYSIVFALTSPCSRGSVRLNPADPTDTPLIDPAYFADDRDVDRMVWGLREARRIGECDALDPWRGVEVSPGSTADDDSDLARYIRTNAGASFNPLGTCRIGVDELAVVDPLVRVYGVEGLRVADASVMPAIVSANTNATVLAVAERAAEMLKDLPVN
jgi:choline dehydrogenase